MQSNFQEGIGLLRIKDQVGIWFSCSGTNDIYTKIPGSSLMTLKELSLNYPEEDLKLYKYAGSCMTDEMARILLYQEMIQQSNFQGIVNVFTKACKDEDALRIDNYLADDIPDDSDPVLDKLEQRVSKLSSCGDNSIHNQDELFQKLLDCGFKEIEF